MVKPCRCGGLILDGVCNRCGCNTKRLDTRTARERGYDYEWEKFSKGFRIDNPLCMDCLTVDRVTPSTEVHHIKKVSTHPDLKYEHTNLVALCSSCHNKRTRRGE